MVNPWTASALNVAVAQQIIENELGYPTEAVSIDENEAMFTGLADGTVDAVLEIWPSGITESEQAFFDDGSVSVIGELGAVGKIGWFVPDYVIEENPDLATWEGYASDEAAALFATAETGDSGRFLGTDPSYSQIRRADHREPGPALRGGFFRAPSRRQWPKLRPGCPAGEPILLYWWTPTAAVSTYNLVNVPLPAYDDACGASAAPATAGSTATTPRT